MRKTKKIQAGILSAGQVKALIKKKLNAPSLQDSFELDMFQQGLPSRIRQLPAWVRRYGLLAGESRYLLWCEPHPEPEDTFPSQVILDLPPGRYMADTLDAASQLWLSRESASGGPLVLGLTYTGNAVMVLIQRQPD